MEWVRFSPYSFTIMQWSANRSYMRFLAKQRYRFMVKHHNGGNFSIHTSKQLHAHRDRYRRRTHANNSIHINGSVAQPLSHNTDESEHNSIHGGRNHIHNLIQRIMDAG